MRENKNKKTKNRIGINIIKLVSFGLVFVMVLEILSATVFSKSNATTFKNNFMNAYNYVNEVEDSIDIVALGNSNMYSALCPLKLWDEQGYTSTIIASPRQTAAITSTLLEDVLKTQSPKIVILEADMFYEGVELDENIVDESTSKKRLPVIPYITDDKITTDIQNRFTVFLLHDQWKNMIANPANIGDDAMFNHGYFFNDEIKETSANDKMNPTQLIDALPDEAVLYMNKIIDICDKENIKLMLINSPSLNTWSYARHNAVEQFAKENNIDYLDFNTLDDYTVEYDKEFRDKGIHVNYYGSSKITAYVGNYIADNYKELIDDKRENAEFLYWNDDRDRFIEYYRIENF